VTSLIMAERECQTWRGLFSVRYATVGGMAAASLRGSLSRSTTHDGDPSLGTAALGDRSCRIRSCQARTAVMSAAFSARQSRARLGSQVRAGPYPGRVEVVGVVRRVIRVCRSFSQHSHHTCSPLCSPAGSAARRDLARAHTSPRPGRCRQGLEVAATMPALHRTTPPKRYTPPVDTSSPDHAARTGTVPLSPFLVHRSVSAECAIWRWRRAASARLPPHRRRGHGAWPLLPPQPSISHSVSELLRRLSALFSTWRLIWQTWDVLSPLRLGDCVSGDIA
jgi:hypothetical protein